MTKFLDKLHKQMLINANKVKGFDFYKSCYQSEPTLNGALTLFFNNFIRDLTEVLTVFEVQLESGAGVKDTKKDIEKFHNNMSVILNKYIEDFAYIVNLHASVSTVEKAEELRNIKLNFGIKLAAKFSELNKQSKSYLQYVKMVSLDLDPSMLHALQVWSELTFTKFFEMLKSGKVDWI